MVEVTLFNKAAPVMPYKHGQTWPTCLPVQPGPMSTAPPRAMISPHCNSVSAPARARQPRHRAQLRVVLSRGTWNPGVMQLKNTLRNYATSKIKTLQQ